jgi:23S rRNA (adenine2503-C2)-methyltransferase
MKEPVFGKTLSELNHIVSRLGLRDYVCRQLAEWLYRRGAHDFEEMTNLSKELRAHLCEEYEIGTMPPDRSRVSGDGTTKYLFSAAGRFVEAAYIPEERRATLCLSTQVGCKMGCLFCMTGKQGFQANLGAREIVNQYASLPEREGVTNIVYMGMGEPLDNLGPVLDSIEILTSEWGFGISPRRITVSTVGVIPALREFLSRSSCRLAISLHSPFEEERRRLMPVEHVYPIAEVLELLRESEVARRRRVSFEYIMFDGVNDTPRHAREIVRILHGIFSRVNLIHFHPIPNTPLAPTPDERMVAFENELKSGGIPTTIRTSRGQDIQAACGLLSTKALVDSQETDY